MEKNFFEKRTLVIGETDLSTPMDPDHNMGQPGKLLRGVEGVDVEPLLDPDSAVPPYSERIASRRSSAAGLSCGLRASTRAHVFQRSNASSL